MALGCQEGSWGGGEIPASAVELIPKGSPAGHGEIPAFGGWGFSGWDCAFPGR